MLETADMVKDRLAHIDGEINEATRANIREMTHKLQERYGEADSKMIKRIMGKMGAPQELWGVHTNYPDTVKISTTSTSPLIQEWQETGTVSCHQEVSNLWVKVVALETMHPLTEHC